MRASRRAGAAAAANAPPTTPGAGRTSPARAIARSGPNPTIVEAKLAPPRLRPGVLPRKALLARLHRAPEARIVALVAPAGYGKSTTLALWRAHETRPVAWVTLDPLDADPMRLVAHLAVAIDRAVGLEPQALLASHGTHASPLETAIPRLVSSLHRGGRPLVLVLDNVHVVARTPAVDALAMLFDYLPPHVVVGLAGRSDAGLPFARYRARGQLLEVGTPALALDARESAELVRRRGGRLDDAEATALHRRTEGWPAAVYLAAREAATAGAASAATGVAAAGPGVGPAIADYIEAELLAATTPAVRRFLVQVSVLDRLTGDLCDAVACRTGSARILAELAATNLMIVRLDTPGRWYRCHTMLQAHLRASLDAVPDLQRELHRRAAAWHAAHGMAGDAIEHSVAAGDLEAAASAATAAILPTYRDGQAATIAGWLAHFDPPAFRRHPYLAAIAAWAAALAGRVGEAERMADLADSGAYADGRPAGAEAFETMRAAGRALMARRGLAAAMADAEWAVAEEPEGTTWRPACLAVLGTMHAVAGDPGRADALLRDCLDVTADTPANRALVSAQAWLAVLAMQRGDWAAAAQRVGEVDQAAARFGHEPDATSAAAQAVAARVALNHGDVHGAARRMAAFQVGRIALSAATPWLSVGALLEAARAYLALGDPAGARAVLLQAEDIIARRRDLGPLPATVAAERERIRGLPPGLGGASTLTPAELRVLRLLPTYLSVPEIAERLIVAPNTVKTQVQAVYGKLGVSSRAEAVERAVEVGLLEPLPILAGDRITRP